ncbi:MAG: substrate-binding domain-containing protein [Rhodospirillales bacterium]
MARKFIIGIIIGFFILSPCYGHAGERFITVASTTSTQNSGLFANILPIFEKKIGISVRVIAVGTGQAIRLARSGDADVLLVHHKPSEIAFVKQGFGVKRFDVMYNDFVIIGPRSDPAQIHGLKSVTKAFSKIAYSKNLFISRGDDSGTHKRERMLWRFTSFDPTKSYGRWYQEIGAGMGAALNIASAKIGYTLSDRGSWLGFKNQSGLAILFEGNKKLLNPYGVILVHPKKHPHVKAKDGQAFIDWLISNEGQDAISDYKIAGKQLFFPNANRITPLG